jgi:predicted Ser/Thr protein kinase
LKRPLDAIKYLQLTVETGDVPLRSQNLPVNCVMIGSANEGQLAAFREHPEFESFRGRLDLIRTPYLTSWVDEQAIYDAQIAPQIRRHVAPHATRIAAMFAVLTRLRRPNSERYEKPLRKIVEDISAMEKLDMYGMGVTPERLDSESTKILRAAIAEIHEESDSYPIYEGSIGASPREMRSVLLDASQDVRYECLSPFAVLTELERLCEKTSEYIWLQQERQPGGYHDHAGFREALRERLLDLMEDEFRVASGLVDDARYQELFERYITHVSYTLKGEKLVNPVTGAAESPDERLMTEVEELLGVMADPEEHRHSLMNSIAAWAIDHPDEQIDNAGVFALQLKRLRDAVFGERRPAVARLCRDLVIVIRADGEGLDESRAAEARAMLERLTREFGYADSSVADAAAALVRERFAASLG